MQPSPQRAFDRLGGDFAEFKTSQNGAHETGIRYGTTQIERMVAGAVQIT